MPSAAMLNKDLSKLYLKVLLLFHLSFNYQHYTYHIITSVTTALYYHVLYITILYMQGWWGGGGGIPWVNPSTLTHKLVAIVSHSMVKLLCTVRSQQ